MDEEKKINKVRNWGKGEDVVCHMLRLYAYMTFP